MRNEWLWRHKLVIVATATLMVIIPAFASAEVECKVGRSATRKPDWIKSNNLPVGRYVRYGIAPPGAPEDSIANGIASGVGRVLTDFARELGVSVQGTFSIESQAFSRLIEGKQSATDTSRVSELIQLQLSDTVEFTGFRVVEIYWERVCEGEQSGYLVWVLGAIPRAIPLAEEETPVPVKRADVLWRSAIIPGWGQFHIKRNEWGSVFVSGFAAGVAATATGFGLRQYYVTERTRTFDSDVRKILNDRIAICDGIGWAGVGLIALTYIMNLINAGLIELPRDYVNFRPQVAFGPGTTPGSLYVSLSLTF